jgi:hypothetical protein
MAVRGNLAGGERYTLRSAALAQSKARANVDGNAALEVRQGKGGLAISTVGGANQVEERIILIDGYQSSIAECPTYWRKVAGEHPYLAYERTRHIESLLSRF